MIEGYKTKDLKAEKTKAKPVVHEEGVLFQDGEIWKFKWGNTVEGFHTKEGAEIALARFKNEQ